MKLLATTGTAAAAAAACASFLPTTCSQIPEEVRVRKYGQRNHVWPPSETDYVPNTPRWRARNQRRFRQLEQFDDPDLEAKWNGFVVAVHSALVCQNFTQYGWGLTKAPKHIVDELRWLLHRGLVSSPPEEEPLEGDSEEEGVPLLFDIGDDLSNEILDELKPIHEAWSGVDLVGEVAYGLRIYRSNATLDMHVDQSSTHVISSIIHVDHDPMGDPWPLVIEDYEGNTNEIFLESGDMLLYESSKLVHGRPRPFIGAWYSSLFVHYFPTFWDEEKVIEDTIYRIPPSWEELKPREDSIHRLLVRGTSFVEPDCEHKWCALKSSKKWEGPVQDGFVRSVGGIERLSMDRDSSQASQAKDNEKSKSELLI